MMLTPCEEIFVLDSCIVIELLRATKKGCKVLSFLKGKFARIELQDVIVSEVSKITGLSQPQIIGRLERIMRKTIYLFVTTDEIKLEALKLQRMYFSCHFPDSIILASCKLRSWTLLTLDRDMARCAELEGILVFNPKCVSR